MKKYIKGILRWDATKPERRSHIWKVTESKFKPYMRLCELDRMTAWEKDIIDTEHKLCTHCQRKINKEKLLGPILANQLKK